MSHTISVIIPVYRATLQTLHDCVNSLQRQQGSGFRIEAVIVFDGEPAFETAPISNWNSPLVSIRTETIAHAGVSAARNAGLRAATGQWAMFLDVDDALAEHAVDGMLAFAVRYRCDVVMGRTATCLQVPMPMRTVFPTPLVPSLWAAKARGLQVWKNTIMLKLTWCSRDAGVLTYARICSDRSEVSRLFGASCTACR